MMDDNTLPAPLAQDQALTKSYRNGRMVGWVQGGVGVLVGLVVWQYLMYFFILAALGGVGYGIYKFWKGKSGDE